MKSDTGQILKSGWGVFLLVSLVLSVAIDLSMPEAESAGGMRRPLFGNGSALLGWIASVIIFVLPPSLLRHFRVAPFSGWLAFGFLLVGYVVWFSITTEPSRTTPKPPSFLLIGGLVLGWRLLTAPRLVIRVDEAEGNEVAPTVLLTELEEDDTPKESTTPFARPNEVPAMIQPGARTVEIIGRAKLQFTLSGLLLILIAFGIHALSEDESPSLTWLIIIAGIWSILAYLAPESWIHSIRSKLNAQTLKRGFRYIGLTVLGLVALWLLIAGTTVAVQLIEKKASQATNNREGAKKNQHIAESDAFGVLRALPSLDDDRRKRAERLLADYRYQQERLGQPLWPTQAKERRARVERVRTVFENPLGLDEDEGAYEQSNRVAPGSGDKLRKKEANVLWLALRYGADETDVRNRYDFYKADMGAKWGTGTLDDEQFFLRAKAEMEIEQSSPVE